MALSPTRFEFRVALSHVDRGIAWERPVIAARHPSETAEHLVLRVLAFCLLYEDGVAFGPGLSDGDGSDLEAHTPDGRLALWVECGQVALAKLRKVAQQNAGAAVHVVFGSARRRDELLAEVAGDKRADGRAMKGSERVTLWSVDPALVAALAGREERRQRWSVTIVGDHVYVEADGASHDGAVTREPLASR